MHPAWFWLGTFEPRGSPLTAEDDPALPAVRVGVRFGAAVGQILVTAVVHQAAAAGREKAGRS